MTEVRRRGGSLLSRGVEALMRSRVAVEETREARASVADDAMEAVGVEEAESSVVRMRGRLPSARVLAKGFLCLGITCSRTLENRARCAV
eukprot:CAMPEP_0177683638 /NCGR_PEP_ID=MMETSP0447-20121125/31929_1 /TAXON_ID=0 /ORGANISM="Stygamoeba regulata, Strain BSH-02190019" /LENGTH=89 /DNA_ID=CAMNT_0019193281 /DNA_START=90 /DNA_END=355 /DNA_ORIENTATION=+